MPERYIAEMRDRFGRQQPKLTSPNEGAYTNALTSLCLGFSEQTTLVEQDSATKIQKIIGLKQMNSFLLSTKL